MKMDVHGNLEILKYLHEIGCPRDEHAFSNAAYSGDIETLKYLYEIGCPLTGRAYRYAKHKNVRKWLIEHGCPR